ncbi:MAG: F0F1 ATP synthase subunit A, partial [Planctomycetales bacterium]|nr:F0F1 ATP synthase subunit A [Planctomycetales bacterium]
AEYFEVPRSLDYLLTGDRGTEMVERTDEAGKPVLEFVPTHADGKIYVPQFRSSTEPVWHLQIGHPQIDQIPEPLDFRVTKFMVVELAVAICCIAVFGWVGSRVATGKPPQGRLWNFFEAMLLFIRDQVARPAIGRHDADKFLPFLWTLFFFILGCNLFGLLPWSGSPTGALATTGTLAVITLGVVVGAGMVKLGAVKFWAAQVPHMDLPLPLAILLKPMIFAIEILGLLIKHFVLSVRLLANMMAGHLVLAVLVTFVLAIGLQVSSFFSPLFLGVGAASIFGAVALSLLELFVAFLQAYIFTFLSALFIGMAVHPH